MNLRGANFQMLGKLTVIAAGMFGFGYALIPIYKHICELTGVNILASRRARVLTRTMSA